MSTTTTDKTETVGVQLPTTLSALSLDAARSLAEEQEAMAIGGDNLSPAGEQCHANDKNRKAFRQRNRAQPQSS